MSSAETAAGVMQLPASIQAASTAERSRVCFIMITSVSILKHVKIVRVAHPYTNLITNSKIFQFAYYTNKIFLFGVTGNLHK